LPFGDKATSACMPNAITFAIHHHSPSRQSGLLPLYLRSAFLLGVFRICLTDFGQLLLLTGHTSALCKLARRLFKNMPASHGASAPYALQVYAVFLTEWPHRGKLRSCLAFSSASPYRALPVFRSTNASHLLGKSPSFLFLAIIQPIRQLN